ncbi:MAG: ATP-dependent DNA helicase [Opitutales bacterium]
MQIDPIARLVRLSVRELAVFRNIPVAGDRSFGQWRAALGRAWHDSARDKALRDSPDARFEVPLHITRVHRDWSFEIQGRMDQLLPDDEALRIREIKSVRMGLPAAAEDLARQLPEAFTQAAIYEALAPALPEYRGVAFKTDLLFIDIDSGALQAVPLADVPHKNLEQQLDGMLPFLEDRREARIRLRDISIAPAFAERREGQEELARQLQTASLKSRAVLLEAPTGFGKTGIVLEHALHSMRDGLYDRLLYLTGKSTGQTQIVQQLAGMSGNRLRFIQMRNRSEHHIDSPRHTCTDDTRCDEDLPERWIAAGIHPPDLLRSGTFALEQARDYGAQTGVCPYALTKGCLPFAEVWIGDTNYIFDPAAQSVFFDPPGFDPARTLLIVDEAHNLPDRAAGALTAEVVAGDLLFALEELRAAGARRTLSGAGEALAAFCDTLSPGKALENHAQYEALDLLENFAHELDTARFSFEDVPPFACEHVWRIRELARRMADPPFPTLLWSPKTGTLRISCLDARNWIAQCIQPFGGAILMSATLSPLDDFRQECGLPEEDGAPAIGFAPWREHAYRVAIDRRVDTRFKKRASYYETTARTIAALVEQSPGMPVAVFFPSYQYARDVATYLEACAPGLRAPIQPRGVDLATQENFILESLLLADALFLVIGSGYAEGVDQLGGRVRTVMIVGPALPEVNALQEAKMQAHPSTRRESAFRDVYVRPAMRRIHQALGRIVRAPGQSARVLLHGRRYAEPLYQNALAPEFQNATAINNDNEFINWLTTSDTPE